MLPLLIVLTHQPLHFFQINLVRHNPTIGALFWHTLSFQLQQLDQFFAMISPHSAISVGVSAPHNFASTVIIKTLTRL